MVKSMPRLVRIRLGGRNPRPPPMEDLDTGERRPGKGGVYFKVTTQGLDTFAALYIYKWV